jgi:hypothetical protein
LRGLIAAVNYLRRAGQGTSYERVWLRSFYAPPQRNAEQCCKGYDDETSSAGNNLFICDGRYQLLSFLRKSDAVFSFDIHVMREGVADGAGYAVGLFEECTLADYTGRG